MAKTGVSAWQVLRNRNFLLLWLGQMVSFVGDYFYWLAIPIMIYQLTGSAQQVGLSLISTALPMLFLGPVAGVFVDRWDRRKTMIIADVLRGLLVLPCLLVETPEQVWIYYLVGFLMSCVSRFFFPAQNAALPLIVPDKDELLAANGLMQIIQTVGLIAGPGLAGFTIGLWGARVAFFFDSASFFVSAGAILLMAVPRTTAVSPAAGRKISALWGEMRDGVLYLFRSRTMVGVLICMAVVQLAIGAINVIWVPFFQSTFGVGAEGLGIVDSAQGAGMVVGGLALGLVASRLRKNTLIGWSVIVIGLLLGGMGLVPQFGYVIALSFGLGLALVPAQSILMTIMQLAVPDLKRGRVGSALNALTTIATLFSMAAASVFGETIGLRNVYLIAGLIIVLSGYLAFRIKEPVPEETDLAAAGRGELVEELDPSSGPAAETAPILLDHGGVE